MWILKCYRTRQPRLSKIENFFASREIDETFETSYVCMPFLIFGMHLGHLRDKLYVPSPDTIDVRLGVRVW